jgi:urease accessory protein
MAAAGAYGVLGLPLHGVETGIALSAIMLGAMVAGAFRPPLWIAAVLVGAFAIFHGYAHGVELPVGADAIAFSMGFVIATGMLHLAGIGFGALSHWQAGRIAVRLAGVVIAVIGFGYLTGVV